MQKAGALFERLRSFAERPLNAEFDLEEIDGIQFTSDEEAHNNSLQAAARQVIEGMLAMIVARARDSWGQPDFRLSHQDKVLPSWAKAVPLGFDFLVAWKRPAKVVFALISQEDREIPIMLFVGAVNIAGPGRCT